MEMPVFNLLDGENKSRGEWWRRGRERGRELGVRAGWGQGGEGAQLTGASSGSGACFPKEVQEA